MLTKLLLALACTAALVGGAAGATRPDAALPRAADTAQIDVEVVDDTWTVPDDLTVRVRLTKITPSEPMAIAWRRMGEGLGGEVIRGAFSEAELPIGQWSPAIAVKSLAGGGGFPAKMFLTITAGRAAGKGGAARRAAAEKPTGAEFELEFALAGKAVKSIREAGPDGPTAGVVIPAYRLTAGRTPADAAFLDELTGISQYAARRTEWLEKLPWASGPLPRKLVSVNNIGGYGEGVGYGIRHTSKEIVATECRALRQLGVNAFRGGYPFMLDMIRRKEGFAKDFDRGWMDHAMGYPVPAYRAGRPADPEAGCPFAPGVTQRTEEGIKRSLEALQLPVQEAWCLTVDEIGAVFDHAPEGKGHVAVCPRCAAGFRQYLRDQGLKPEDFGRKAWNEVAPSRMHIAPPPGAGGKGAKAGKAPSPAVATQAAALPAPAAPNLTDPHEALLAYHTAKFVNYASARLFAPLAKAFDAANAAKKKALDAGKADDPVARQPWVYSYALRGNTFLMKGHSLDFFDFYRQADNAFVYETSNRGPQVWGWDSYLCDVGRVVSSTMGKQFGIYIKPHRGAPVQRMLAAAARGARMIYWYTYGPDYHKGDSFSQEPEALELASKAAHLLGAAEEALYGSRWMHPAEVAVVKPRSSEIWMRLDPSPARDAAWENAKWTYTALQHAHVPVDPLDEEMLATADLSRYKVIYVGGPNLTRAAAGKLAAWVQAGGTLYTSGGGLARDEANRPLEALAPVLGLTARKAPEMYYQVALYGATNLEGYDEPARRLAAVPEGARVTGDGLMKAAFAPVVGREVLSPGPAATVLARFADGTAAAVCSPYGKGKAYVVGFFAGLEYSAGIRGDRFDMSKGFDADVRSFIAAPALERVRPVVDGTAPAVEGILLVNDSNGRRAVTLANWAYRVAGLRKRGRGFSPVIGIAPITDLSVTIRGPGKVAKVSSAWLGKPLTFMADADAVTIRLPRLEEGDVLLLE